MIRTINDIYLDLRAEFRKKGIAGYQIEARDLVAFALDLSDEEFVARRNQYIFDKDVQKIEELKALRYSGVPLQHITGRWEFYGLPLVMPVKDDHRSDNDIRWQSEIKDS